MHDAHPLQGELLANRTFDLSQGSSEIKRDHSLNGDMERGQYLTPGTGRIRPLADSKQATDEKRPPCGI
jgi:hypothetical protein